MAALSVRSKFPGPFTLHGGALRQVRHRALLPPGDPHDVHLAIVVTVLTIMLGYPVAPHLVRSRSRRKHLIFLGVISPLLVSIVVRTIGWPIVLGNEEPVNNLLRGLGVTGEPWPLMHNFWSVTVGLVYVLLPFMILSIAGVLGKIDPALEESAAVLGAKPGLDLLARHPAALRPGHRGRLDPRPLPDHRHLQAAQAGPWGSGDGSMIIRPRFGRLIH
jgi:putative spermidine/putrescine transport system permease protein